MADQQDVSVIIGAKIDELLSKVDQVNKALGTISEHAEKQEGLLRGLASGFLAAFSVDAIFRFIDAMAQVGEKTETLMATLGLSAEKVGVLAGMAKLGGVSMEGLALSIERMYTNVQRANADAFSPAAQGLKALGLNAKELIGIPTDQYIEKLNAAVSKFNPSLNLMSALTLVGGRGMATLAPILIQSTEKFHELQEEVKRAEDGFARAIPGMAETHKNLTLLSISAQSAGIRIFSVLQPAINAIIKSITSWVQALDSEKIKAGVAAIGDKTLEIIGAVGNLALSVLEIFERLSGGIDELLKKLSLVATGMIAGGLLGGPVGAALGLGVGLGVDELRQWYEGVDKNMADGNKAAEKRRADFAATMEGMRQSFAKFKDSLGKDGEHGEAGHGQDAPAVNLNARQSVEIAKSKIEQTIALEQGKLDRLKLLYDLDATNFNISQTEKVRLTLDATRNMFSVEQEGLKRIRDLWPAGTKEWQEAEKARVLASSRAQTEILRLQIEAFKTIRTEVGGYVGTIESSWNSSLRDMLAGTMSFKDAMKKVLGDLIIYWIEQLQKKFLFEKLTTALTSALYTGEKATEVGVHAGAEAAKTTATATGVAARTGAEGAGMLASMGATITQAISFIGAQVAKVFAGVSAFFAPIIGPAAPAAGAAEAATVSASALALLPSLDTGTWEVPGDMTARIHKGEMVVPRFDAEQFRSGGGGGFNLGGLTVVAQGRTTRQEMQAHGDTIVDIIMNAGRNGRLNGLKIGKANA